VDKVAASIKEFGFKQPIVVDKEFTIIAGHTRLKAAKKLGLKEVPVIVADDLNDAQVKAYRLADNKTAEFAEWDMSALATELQELETVEFDMARFGFENKNLPIQDDFDIDKELDKIEEPISKLGDIWQLGGHRLICGDSTEYHNYENLFKGKTAQMCITSPPYGVGKSYEQKGIEPWKETISGVINNITKFAGIVCWNLVDLYSTGGQYIEPTTLYSLQMFADCGFKPIWIRIWEKQGINFGVGAYHLVTNKPAQQYEFISCVADKDDYIEEREYSLVTAYGNHVYKFVKRLSKEERREWGYSGIWKINTVRANKEHPAMFPVELPWRCIKMHSDEGGIILDPFDGSGTTIIACEQINRQCYGIELDPKYVDLAIKRWEQFTGQKAVLINGGTEGVSIPCHESDER